MRRGSWLPIALILLGGCATFRTAATGDSAGYAAPGPEIAGTWSGMAWAVGGSLYHISAPVTVSIRPDGTWDWSKRGVKQATGRVRVQGDRVLLEEDQAKEGAQTIQLMRRGDLLWGLSRAFIPDAESAVELRKAAL